MSEALPSTLKRLAHKVASLLTERNETICVAETTTGGLISASLVSFPGASKIYKGGLTIYTLESRVQFAGWTDEDTKNYRGPTTDVVSKVSQNVREKLGATYCICESGTAGPTGGSTPNRTPGYVALAVAGPNGTEASELNTGLGGDREANMIRFAEEALSLVKAVVSSQSHTRATL